MARPVSSALFDCYINLIGQRKIDPPSTPLFPYAGLEEIADKSKREGLTTKKVFEKLQQEAG